MIVVGSDPAADTISLVLKGISMLLMEVRVDLLLLTLVLALFLAAARMMYPKTIRWDELEADELGRRKPSV
jgi:hypothetical protein